MAKRIKVKGNAPRGLSKYERQYNYAYKSRGGLGGGRREGNREMMYTVKHVNRDGTVEPHDSPIADKNAMSRPSSTRKKLVKEGSRKFIGPRQLSSELAEDRGRGNLNTPASYRSYHRQLDREILEHDDPTVDVRQSNVGRVGRLRGGLSPNVVAKLKALAQKIMAKPENQMTDQDRNFIRNIDSMGHFLGNYRV